MQDVVFLSVIVGFFILSALYVVLCDRIIGPDEVVISDTVGASAGEKKVESH